MIAHSRETYQPTSIMRWDRGIFNGSFGDTWRVPPQLIYHGLLAGINTLLKSNGLTGTPMLLELHKLDFMCAIWCHLPSIYLYSTIHLPIFSLSRNILMMQSVNDVNLAKFLDFDAPRTDPTRLVERLPEIHGMQRRGQCR